MLFHILMMYMTLMIYVTLLSNKPGLESECFENESNRMCIHDISGFQLAHRNELGIKGAMDRWTDRQTFLELRRRI